MCWQNGIKSLDIQDEHLIKWYLEMNFFKNLNP